MEAADYLDRLAEQLKNPDRILVRTNSGKSVRLVDLSPEEVIEQIRIWVSRRQVPLSIVE